MREDEGGVRPDRQFTDQAIVGDRIANTQPAPCV
jgi:hypothetical protein